MLNVFDEDAGVAEPKREGKNRGGGAQWDTLISLCQNEIVALLTRASLKIHNTRRV